VLGDVIQADSLSVDPRRLPPSKAAKLSVTVSQGMYSATALGPGASHLKHPRCQNALAARKPAFRAWLANSISRPGMGWPHRPSAE
jgi:hypothetical protein